MLTALVFALGGNARVASRGNSNKAFIRTDQTSAVVEVRLTNVGEGAYKPEVYGKSIRIERRVTNSASSYRIMDDKGKPVVEKKHKEELERILMAFNIQVENPIAVLNQDTAKTFLFKCDPDKLYTFFMKATQLEACKTDYNEANVQKEHTASLLGDKMKSLPALEKEAAKWEKKYQFQLNLNNKKKDIHLKKGELAWAKVRDLEIEASQKEEEIDNLRKKITLSDEKAAKEVQKEKDYMKEKKRLEKEIQEIAQSENDNNKKMEELKNEFKAKRNSMKDADNVVEDLKTKKKGIQRDINVLESEITKLRTQGTEEWDREHQKRMSDIRKHEENIATLSAEVATTENHLRHLTENARECENKVLELKSMKMREAGVTRNIQADLDALSGRNGRNKFAAYGQHIVNLVAEISRSKKFRKTPIGPIGAHIKVKEGVSEKLRRAIEHELSGILNAFIVDNDADRQELFSLMNKVRMDRKPTVFTTPFTAQKYDVSQNRVYTDQYQVLIDYIDIENANVYNRVVDSCSLERILFIENENDAKACLSREDLVPRNTKYATVANHYHYFPAPNYKSYYHDERVKGNYPDFSYFHRVHTVKCAA